MNQLKYAGKTKDVYQQPNGNLLIVFKDDVTGEGGVVDPGSNLVLGKIKGKGRMSLEMTHYFFGLFQKAGIPTHLVAVDLERTAMEVREAMPPGRHLGASGALEFVCRLKACGSFVKRYQKYLREKLQPLDRLVEITLKDDERGDPPVSDDTILALGILTPEQLRTAKDLTRQAAALVAAEWQARGLDLIDLKVEFGLVDGRMTMIDELSADCMRVMDAAGRTLSHAELCQRLLAR